MTTMVIAKTLRVPFSAVENWPTASCFQWQIVRACIGFKILAAGSRNYAAKSLKKELF